MNGQISSLKGASVYIRHYRDKIFVLKVGGNVLSDADALKSFAEQCGILENVGIRLVIVHGGGPQANELSERLGAKPQKIAGRRITDDAALEVVKMAYAGLLNTDLVAALQKQGINAVGLTGVDGRLLVATRRPPVEIRDDDGVLKQVDFGHVGDIVAVNAAVLEKLQSGGFVPVIGSLCIDDEGRVLNVNADSVAEAVATAVGADKLVFLSDRRGVLQRPDDPLSLLPFGDAGDLQKLLENGTIVGGMRVKVEACLRACTNGVRRTHIIDGTAKDSLLQEIFTGDGCGTMIVAEREKHLYEEEELG